MRMIFLFIALAMPTMASAEPVWLNCSASGEAGSVRFRFVWDEEAHQAFTMWESGGGRPTASFLGAAGTDNAVSGDPRVTAIQVIATFRPSPAIADNQWAYGVEVNRLDGTMRFTRFSIHRQSYGSCVRATVPRRF